MSESRDLATASRPDFAKWLFPITIGLSAFLLFQVQFILAKLILPWFGGASSVWTTCMLFFQTALLLGYGYAHWLSETSLPKRQRNLHVAALGLAVLVLLCRLALWPSPITPSDSWKPPAAGSPIPQILLLLLVSVGLPYIALAATGPLLQSWYARIRPGEPPYRLYALSNIGSLAGLLTYPVLVEPALSVTTQGRVWAIGFGLFASGCAAAAGSFASSPVPNAGALTPAVEPPPPASVRRLWFGLSAVPSILLLATTNQMCQEVAVIPFLWVLPLSLYLVSLIVCFEYERLYKRALWTGALFLAAAGATVVLFLGISVDIRIQIGVYAVCLFVYCMVCHGELVRLKPGPAHLTSFYLTVAAGGAAGGLFTGLVAPALFPSFWELPLALFLGWRLLATLLVRDPNAWIRTGRWARLKRSGLSLWLLALGGALAFQAWEGIQDSVYVRRNFFGVLRILRDQRSKLGGAILKLRHGRITHGMQYQEARLRRLPTTYYGEESGVGLALARHPRRLGGAPLRVGVVGLGTGTLAAYCQPGDVFRFYEINPKVIELSVEASSIFTYLRDAPGDTRVVLGDARLSMERQEPQDFDVLALDAFSSDSIPVHLLTREAFALYLRHLRKPDGIIAVHISNRYLNLKPVVQRLAEVFGLAGLTISSKKADERVWSSDWILVSSRAGTFLDKSFQDAGRPLDGGPRRPLWTDNYSNLWQVLKR